MTDDDKFTEEELSRREKWLLRTHAHAVADAKKQ